MQYNKDWDTTNWENSGLAGTSPGFEAQHHKKKKIAKK
jgi:hypothetical protein